MSRRTTERATARDTSARSDARATALLRERSRRADAERAERPTRRRMKVQLGLVVGSVFATVFLVFGLWQATIAAGRGTAGRATLAFHARVREAVGVPLQPGDGCQADVDVEARDGTADRVGLVLRCGGRLLYDSGASQGALSFVDFAAEESDGPEPESSVVALRYEDTGAPERRAQIHFDSHARSATLWRDGSTAFRVTLDVAPWSDAHTGGRLLAHDAAQP